MKPIFSDENRKETLWNFIAGYVQGRIKVTDYTTVTNYLNDHIFMPLFDFKPSGKKFVSGHGNIDSGLFTAYDAKIYFDWLMNTVAGAYKSDEAKVGYATDQLYILIIAMRPVITIDGTTRIVAPYNWEDQLTVFVDKLSALQKTIDKRDALSSEIMEKILAWLTEFTPVLEEVQKDYSGKLGKAIKK